MVADGVPPYRHMIRDMEADERPRERLRAVGPSVLTNAELLAIILNTGIKGEGVLSVSHRVLSQQGGLSGLNRLSVEELARVRGVGEAKAAKVKAALELGRRMAASTPEERYAITEPGDVNRLLGVEMAALEQEQLRVVLLDTRHRVMAVRTVYQGSVNAAQVRVGEVFREAVRANATAQILVHNHPSGDPTPSAADVTLTADVVRSGAMLDIAVLDHVVIGDGRWVSMKRLGLGFGEVRGS